MKVPVEFDLPLARAGALDDDLRRRALWLIYCRAVACKNAPWVEELWTSRTKREREVRRLIKEGLSEEANQHLHSWGPPADLENATLEEGRVLEERAWNEHQESLRLIIYAGFRLKGPTHEEAVALVRRTMGKDDWECPVASEEELQAFSAVWDQSETAKPSGVS